MTSFDPHDLLVRSTSELQPAGDLVDRGIALGRSRRRRHLATTGLAACVLLGAAAVGVPQLLPGEAGRDTTIGQPAGQPGAEAAVPGQRVPIDAEDGAAVLASLMPVGEVRDPANDTVRQAGVKTGEVEGDQVPEVASRLVFDGGVVEAEVSRFHSEADAAKAAQVGMPLETAAEACTYGDSSECSLLDDGSYLLLGTSGWREDWMEGTDQYLVTQATLWTTDGYVVRLFAYNVGPQDADADYGQLQGDEQDRFVVVNGGEPVLTPEELKAVATSPDWFQPAP